MQVPCYQRSTSAGVMRPQNGNDWHHVAATVAADTLRLIARSITSSIALQAGAHSVISIIRHGCGGKVAATISELRCVYVTGAACVIITVAFL